MAVSAKRKCDLPPNVMALADVTSIVRASRRHEKLYTEKCPIGYVQGCSFLVGTYAHGLTSESRKSSDDQP